MDHGMATPAPTGGSDDEDISTELWQSGREISVGYSNFTDPSAWEAFQSQPGASRPWRSQPGPEDRPLER